MKGKITIIGGTGMLGRPVAEQMKTDGFDVTITSSQPDKVDDDLKALFDVQHGDVTNPDSLKPILEGRDFVYVNLNSKLDPELYQRIEIEGTANVASVAKQMGLKRIGMISGASSKGEEEGVLYLDAKVRAERALIESGVPYTIMRPSWFFESLPMFVQGDRAGVLGKQPIPRRWLSVSDYAKQVSKAFRTDEAANKCFYNYGPEALTLLEAVKRFCARHYPELQPQSVSFMLAKIGSAMPGMEKLKVAIPFFEYMDTQPEDGDGAEADRVLGVNPTTIEQWIDAYVKP